jgi:hypothetical protein
LHAVIFFRTFVALRFWSFFVFPCFVCDIFTNIWLQTTCLKNLSSSCFSMDNPTWFLHCPLVLALAPQDLVSFFHITFLLVTFLQANLQRSLFRKNQKNHLTKSRFSKHTCCSISMGRINFRGWWLIVSNVV